jgi:ABC-2 type transport system ATP-binding protein
MPENVPLYTDMRVEEYLRFVGEAKGLAPAEAKKEAGRCMAAVGVDKRARQLIKQLSKGYRQRVGLAQALLNNPMILLLDEPASGLDPEQVAEVRRMVRGLAGERTVILSSHILSEVSRICNRVIIMDKGAVVASGTPEALGLQLQESNCLRVQIDPDGEAVAKKLAALPGVSRVDRGDQAGRNGAYYIIHAQNGVDAPRALCALAFENGWVLREFSPVTLSLEDVFLKLTAGDGARA